MKLSETSLDENRTHIEATASSKEVDEAFDILAEQSEGQNDDQAPYHVAERLFPFALSESGILPAYPPQVKYDAPPQKGKEFTFTIDVVHKPSFELESYGPVTLTLSKTEIFDFEVDAQLVELAESFADYVADEPRPLVLGDAVLVSMETTDEGKPVDELTFTERIYRTGENMMPPGFDDDIVGMEPGQKKKVAVTGPIADAEGKAVEKTVDCMVTIISIQKRVIPSITDAWVKENFPMFETETRLREEIKKQMEQERTKEHEEKKRQMAVTELCARFKDSIDDVVFEENKKALMSNIAMQLAQQGMSMEWFIEQNGGQMNFDVTMNMRTKQTLTEGYALDAVFRHENMTVEEEDILAACKTIDPENPEEVRKQMEKSGYRFAVRETAERIKATTWLVDNAIITPTE